MGILPTRAKGFGLKFQTGIINTDSLCTMRLDTVGPPDIFLEHEEKMPLFNGKRFVFDQSSTSTCVANAFLHGILMKEARGGFQFDQPSRLYPYWHSRKEHGGQWFDSGTYLHTLATALRKFGAPSERYWKFGTFSTRVNRRPNWTAMRKAHPRRDGRYVRIYQTGVDRINAIKQTLLNGHDVAFGTRVAKSFQPSFGVHYIERPAATDPVAGNHAMLIIGWTMREGRLWFRVLNSWGSGWRNSGLCWMSAEYITWNRTTDLHVIHGWSKLRS